ncbi:hypothetical protein PIB30_089960 [Stylosanthes scabra]|uniref:Uncharacterized protein n=1 Tax=Stylosanthes scabra TaxID=79078 RepID=A0ABU6QUI0_9FABA|nr:hypothetical protein [Stylosanthes scabra]
MEDLSMFQRPRTVALEDKNPGTYGTSLIYQLDRLVSVASWVTRLLILGLASSVDARVSPERVAYEEELKRLKAERQVIIDVGGPKPPPIDEDALWAQFAGGHRKGRIYGKGVVPSHKYPPLFVDTDEDDTATGPPDVREQVVLLNRELSQQAEAYAHKVAAVEAVCSEKVRSLESTVQA